MDGYECGGGTIYVMDQVQDRRVCEDDWVRSLSIDQVPEAWNRKYTEYLGITPDSDKTGVLQDVHWTSGFGYFPSYALGNAYNAMYEDSTQHIEQLRASAERDPLTGISNRSGYESFLATHTRHVALLLLDIDGFGEYNSLYGHDTGDAILTRLADALTVVFRSTDFPCRIESDRFAVVMTDVDADLSDVIAAKVEHVRTILADEADDLPLVTLSVGVAFGAEGMADRDIAHAADEALRRAKQSDTDSVVFA